MVGNGLHPRGPCRYAYVAQPAPYTKRDHLRAWAVGPPTTHLHTPPMRGTRDDECHSCLAGPRHQACQSSQSHSVISAAVGRDTEYLIGQHELVIHPLGVLNLCIDVK